VLGGVTEAASDAHGRDAGVEKRDARPDPDHQVPTAVVHPLSREREEHDHRADE
jgi:hypothetical protein